MDPIDRFSALYFDLDGTLVDTMPLHHMAYAEVFAGHGYRLPLDVYMSLIGAPAREAIPKFCSAVGWTGLDDAGVARLHADKKAKFERVLIEHKPVRLPAADLAERWRGRRPLALVSSGNRQGVSAILQSMGWQELFDVVISGDDVRHGKPAPEAYLLAALRLSLPTEEGLALEDTDDGLAAARAAGMQVLDVRRDEVVKEMTRLVAPPAGQEMRAS